MNSKGETDNTWTVVIALIILLVVVFIGYNFLRSSARSGDKIADLFSEDNTCLQIGMNQKSLGRDFEDIDSDTRPDYCDICVCENCDNDKDQDKDNIPAECDLDDSDREIGMCSKESGCEGTKCCKKDGSCGKGGTVKEYVDSFRCVIS